VTRENQDALAHLWREEATAWLVGRYTLMPDHVHFFAALADETCDLDTWTRYWKRRFGQIRGLPPHSLQEGKWDTRMRTADQYQEKWDYVRNNPVRRGLVARAEDWPYSGVVHRLPW
jgi:REP element-mobilizing transposase RayT